MRVFRHRGSKGGVRAQLWIRVEGGTKEMCCEIVCGIKTEGSWRLCSFPRAAVTECRKLGTLNDSSGGRKSESKMSAGMVPSAGGEGESVPRDSPSFRLPQAFPGL